MPNQSIFLTDTLHAIVTSSQTEYERRAFAHKRNQRDDSTSGFASAVEAIEEEINAANSC